MTDDVLTRFLTLSPADRRKLLSGDSGQDDSRAGRIPAIDRGKLPARLPASPGQQAQWTLWRIAPDSVTYHVPACYEISGPLQPSLLTQAVNAVVARHEVMRTTYAQEGTKVVQVIHRHLPADIRIGTAGSRDEAVGLAAAAAREPFDLGKGPLVRVRLWRFAPQRHLLLILLHHITVDERSSRILERELAAYYGAAVTERPAILPTLPVQYADYAVWQRSLDSSADLVYWSQQLAGATGVRLPPDRPWPAVSTLPGTTVQLPLPGVREALAHLSARLGGTPFTALAAAFAVFLAGETGRDDVSFGCPVASRTDREVADLIGYFMNSVVLRVRTPPSATFAQLAAETREVVGGALRHQAAPFHEVVTAVGAKPDGFHNPLFGTMLVFLSGEQTGHHAALAPDLPMRPVILPMPNAHQYVTFTVVEEPEAATLVVHYPSDAYTTETVERWADRLDNVITRIAADSSVLVADLARSPETLEQAPR
ncbi:condensation domain-containing protein [Amycolatopsis sp. cmx-11-12]|uniref:condensation domain-containing protein n=1 Tax=Amycolatopsis sp. cmx-11-12 TaxID=2785795 RepID=UPI0039175182